MPYFLRAWLSVAAYISLYVRIDMLFTHACIHTYIHIFCAHTHARMYLSTYNICINTCIYIYIMLQMCVCVRRRAPACLYNHSCLRKSAECFQSAPFAGRSLSLSLSLALASSLLLSPLFLSLVLCLSLSLSLSLCLSLSLSVSLCLFRALSLSLFSPSLSLFPLSLFLSRNQHLNLALHEICVREDGRVQGRPGDWIGASEIM